MRIIAIETIPLRHHTPAGGWADEVVPAENLHTLLKVVTDSGIAGWGSVYTSQALVEASLKLLRPFSWARRPSSRNGWPKGCTRPPSGRGGAGR